MLSRRQLRERAESLPRLRYEAPDPLQRRETFACIMSFWTSRGHRLTNDIETRYDPTSWAITTPLREARPLE